MCGARSQLCDRADFQSRYRTYNDNLWLLRCARATPKENSPMSANVIAFPCQSAPEMSITDQQLDELRAGVRPLVGEWRVEKIVLGGGCAYALLIPGSWGNGATGAFDIFRRGNTLSLPDYRRQEFFGGREDYQGALCGVFVSVDAVCDALADLVGTKRTPADQRDVGGPSHGMA
jgi:hypothetical protein